jgi:hypothetical protein
MTRLQLHRACKANPSPTKPTQSKVVYSHPFSFDRCTMPTAFAVARKPVYVCASRFRAPDCDFTIKPW